MPERLTAVEWAALAQQTVRTPAVVGTVTIVGPVPVTDPDEQPGAAEEPIGADLLMELIRDRIRYVPRYRQRIREVPGRLADPVWVDDQHFDLDQHVRRAVLPRPGRAQQLREFTERVISRPMDRTRPLWDLYLVEGLDRGRTAIVSRTHLALVDGIDTVDLVQELLDADPQDVVAAVDDWSPLPEPGDAQLFAGAVTESVQQPRRIWTSLQHAVSDGLGLAAGVSETVGLVEPVSRLASELSRGAWTPTRTPLHGRVGERRRLAEVSHDLDQLHAVGRAYGHTVHDVLLAMITGGLRRWLLSRGEAVPDQTSLSALVPLSVDEDDDRPSSLGTTVVGHRARLPIGEPDGLARLHQIGYGTEAHQQSGRATSAEALSRIPGFAPPTLHVLGARTGAESLGSSHDLIITHAPGPESPVHLGRAPVVVSYPVLPLTQRHLLAIGATSYNGRMMIGLNADRDELDDLAVLAQSISDELSELLQTTKEDR